MDLIHSARQTFSCHPAGRSRCWGRPVRFCLQRSGECRRVFPGRQLVGYTRARGCGGRGRTYELRTSFSGAVLPRMSNQPSHIGLWPGAALCLNSSNSFKASRNERSGQRPHLHRRIYPFAFIGRSEWVASLAFVLVSPELRDRPSTARGHEWQRCRALKQLPRGL